LNSNVLVDVYGPLDLYEQYVFPPNLDLKGAVRDLYEIELSNYDVFLFTSKFEGMPNSVLEAANVGIPIIAADVGGIKETFGTEAIYFYENASTTKLTALNISKAFQEYLEQDESAVVRRVVRAKQMLIDKHGADTFRSHVRNIFFDNEESIK
jgi:glycosyltransferase involved in cell wall biosynthesis